MLIFLNFLAIAALVVAEIEAQENVTIRFDLEDRSWTTTLHEKCKLILMYILSSKCYIPEIVLAIFVSIHCIS